MPADRFYLDSPLDLPTLQLKGTEFHHLAHVMRIKLGQKIELVNGQGSLAIAEVSTLQRDHADLTLLSHSHSPAPSPLILALALTRPSLLDWTIEKATELGTTQIWLFPGDRSEKNTLSPSQLLRLQTLLITALKQCGSLFLPTFQLHPPLQEWTPPTGSLFFGDLSPSAPLLQGPFSSPVIFFIGPEKGFSSQEIGILRDRFKAQGISFHPHTLRAETAAICALSQYYRVAQNFLF